MNAWTRRGIVVIVVLAVVWLSGGLSDQWFGQTLAAPEVEQLRTPATTIAMIDIAYIYKNHKAFTSQMKVLEQEALAFQQRMQATEAQLKLIKARIEQTDDKEEKEKLEVELATQGAAHQLSTRKAQENLGTAEAKVYYDSYMMLQEETKKYCRARGIHVALKFDREVIKADDRNSVMRGLGRPIIFSDAPDISEDILKALDAAAEVKAAKAKGEETKSR